MSAAPGARTSAPVMVIFEYVGSSALMTVGPVTRTLYRFTAPHERVAVDGRDAAAIGGVPNLRRVR